MRFDPFRMIRDKSCSKIYFENVGFRIKTVYEKIRMEKKKF